MLGQKNRLKKSKDIGTVSGARPFFGRFLVLKKTKNGLKDTRVAFVVSRKVSAKAVVRNKIKRRLGEATRGALPKIKPGYDIVFFTKKGIEEEDFREIKQTVEGLLKKSKLI